MAAARHLVLVTPADSYRTGAFLDAARASDHRVTVVTDAPVAIPGSAVVVDLDDPDGAAAQVIECLAVPPDAVLATDGPAVLAGAVLARGLGLVGSPPEATRWAGDKAAQRSAVERAGLRQPRWVVVPSGGPWPDLGPGPVVVKPTDRRAGQGVIRADTPYEGRAALGRVRRLLGPGAAVLVERYVSGTEVAAELLLVAGEVRPLAVFDKPDAGSGPHFAETLLVRPARLADDAREDLLDLAREAVAAVGLTDGAVHFEARIDDLGRPWFLELAARSIGGRCSSVIRPLGRPLESLLIDAALARPLPPDLGTPGGAAGVHMIPVPRSGVYRGVQGAADAEAVPGVTGVELTTAPGTEVEALPEGDRYLGFVFAEGPDPDDVERSLRRAARALTVSVSPSGSRDRSRPDGR